MTEPPKPIQNSKPQEVFAWMFVRFLIIHGKFLAREYTFLGGGFKYFLFSPLLGEDSHFD